jgi:hypothetical protein
VQEPWEDEIKSHDGLARQFRAGRELRKGMGTEGLRDVHRRECVTLKKFKVNHYRREGGEFGDV